jgi:hypothetical protein
VVVTVVVTVVMAVACLLKKLVQLALFLLALEELNLKIHLLIS